MTNSVHLPFESTDYPAKFNYHRTTVNGHPTNLKRTDPQVLAPLLTDPPYQLNFYLYENRLSLELLLHFSSSDSQWPFR